ncbi:MAG: hypothetical protein BalsKO_24280 [Balneolaceae bacterium]
MDVAFTNLLEKATNKKMNNFEQRLTGGHPNSLGNTVEVVEQVLDQNELFDELFNCYFSDDEVVRLRTSSAIKRVCKAKKELFFPYIDRFFTEIAVIDQASTQWTLAQLFDLLKRDMSDFQLKKAIEIMQTNIEHHKDWIVLNTTMGVLGNWSKRIPELKLWLVPHLERLASDPRKSVSSKASKTLALLAI